MLVLLEDLKGSFERSGGIGLDEDVDGTYRRMLVLVDLVLWTCC
jgi:hypothetical protein